MWQLGSRALPCWLRWLSMRLMGHGMHACRAPMGQFRVRESALQSVAVTVDITFGSTGGCNASTLLGSLRLGTAY
jgi:hypothetical protein